MTTSTNDKEKDVSHGKFKPRNKYLNDLLMSKKGGVHEAKSGKQAKRAKVNRAMEREMRSDQY